MIFLWLTRGAYTKNMNSVLERHCTRPTKNLWPVSGENHHQTFQQKPVTECGPSRCRRLQDPLVLQVNKKEVSCNTEFWAFISVHNVPTCPIEYSSSASNVNTEEQLDINRVSIVVIIRTRQGHVSDKITKPQPQRWEMVKGGIESSASQSPRGDHKWPGPRKGFPCQIETSLVNVKNKGDSHYSPLLARLIGSCIYKYHWFCICFVYLQRFWTHVNSYQPSGSYFKTSCHQNDPCSPTAKIKKIMRL